jgi:hypothetical protein
MLSAHFSLEELVATQQRGIDNAPPPEIVERLKHSALGMEAVRVRLSVPIIVSSGYRCPALNAAVGGRKDSQHLTGDAVDFIAPGFGGPTTVVCALKDSGILFDQLIVEFNRWVHISFSEFRRHEVLAIDAHGTRPFMA